MQVAAPGQPANADERGSGCAADRFASGLIWSAPTGIADPAQRQRSKDPEHNDGDHSGSADRTLRGFVCYRTMLNHDLVGNERHHQPDAERHDDQIVEIADDRNEIWNEVDRRKRISGNGDREKFDIPWHTRVAGGEIDRVGVSAEPARPDFQTREHEVFLKWD